MNKRHRVVITGMGILAPNGIGLEAFWESLLAGRSGIGPITLFDATGFKSQVAGEVKDFNPLDYIEPELKPNASYYVRCLDTTSARQCDCGSARRRRARGHGVFRVYFWIGRSRGCRRDDPLRGS